MGGSTEGDPPEATSAADAETTSTAGTSSGAGATDGAGSSTGASTGPGPCDDTVLTPEDDPFQTCSNLGPVCAPICDQATAGMKAAIAGRTIKCLANECDCPSDIAVCTEKSTVCVLETLGTACADTTADAACEQIVDVCGEELATCHAVLDGLTEDARADATSCALADCAGGLEACVVGTLVP